MSNIYLEAGGVKSLWLISDEFKEYCNQYCKAENEPKIKNEDYFDGDDESWFDSFISDYLEKKYWNKIFTLDYDDDNECFTIYEIEIPEYKLKQQASEQKG